jgi:hypothetical protein
MPVRRSVVVALDGRDAAAGDRLLHGSVSEPPQSLEFAQAHRLFGVFHHDHP